MNKDERTEAYVREIMLKDGQLLKLTNSIHADLDIAFNGFIGQTELPKIKPPEAFTVGEMVWQLESVDGNGSATYTTTLTIEELKKWIEETK